MEEGEAQEVKRIERTVLDSIEHFATLRKQLVLPMRGNIPFVRLLHQSMDLANVVALDLRIADKELLDIRRVDKKLEDRIERMLRAAGKISATAEGFQVTVRLKEIVG